MKKLGVIAMLVGITGVTLDAITSYYANQSATTSTAIPSILVTWNNFSSTLPSLTWVGLAAGGALLTYGGNITHELKKVA